MIKLELIQNLNDAQDVANVRNSGREFLTHYTDYISPQQQSDWFFKTYVPANQEGDLFVYLARSGADAVGYGLISKKDGAYWITGVLTPETRGKGYGRELFEFLRDEAKKMGTVKLDVLNDNEVAYSLYLKLGFKVVNKTKVKTVMEIKK